MSVVALDKLRAWNVTVLWSVKSVLTNILLVENVLSRYISIMRVLKNF